MIEFIKPANLDGNILEAELKAAGITIPERSISVANDVLYLDITEAQKATAQGVIDSIYG
jgi:hypothetical protein